jgi:hypothetical protein
MDSCVRCLHFKILHRLARLIVKCIHIQIDKFEGWREREDPSEITPLFACVVTKPCCGLATTTAPVTAATPFPDRSQRSKLTHYMDSAVGQAAAIPQLDVPVAADAATLAKALDGESALVFGGAEAGHNAAVSMPKRHPQQDTGDMLALQGVLTLPPLAADTTDPAVLAARLQINPASNADQLNEGLFHYLITRPWVTDTIDGVQYFCAEQVSTALGEEHKAACCRQQVAVLQAAFDHEAKYLAQLLHGTARQQEREGQAAKNSFSTAAERVSALVQHIVNSEPADLLQDHSHQSLAHALGMSQASTPPALTVALQRLRERHFQLRAAQLAAQAVAADAEVYRDAASQIVYQSHGLMCLLTLTENSSWEPMRDVPRLQHARQQLQSQEQVWGLLSALQDTHCWWATPAAQAAVAEGYSSFLRQCVRLAVRTAMHTREAQTDALRQRISLIASSCQQSAEQLCRVMSQQEFTAATRVLPPPPPLPSMLHAAMHGSGALNPFVPLVLEAPPANPFAPPSTAQSLGFDTGAQSATAIALGLAPSSAAAPPAALNSVQVPAVAAHVMEGTFGEQHSGGDGMGAAFLSTLQHDVDDSEGGGGGLPLEILAMIEQEMQGLAPPLSLEKQQAVLTLAARLRGEHGLLAKGVPPPVTYPPTAMDCIPWAVTAPSPRAAVGSALERPALVDHSFDRLVYEEGASAGGALPNTEEVAAWIRLVIGACGVPAAAFGAHCACVALTLQQALQAGDLLRQAHAAQVASEQFKDLPLLALTPASWRGAVLGAAMAWVGPLPDVASAESSGAFRTTQPAIAAAKAAITGTQPMEPLLDPEGAVPRVPALCALSVAGQCGVQLQWPPHWRGEEWSALTTSMIAMASPLAAMREWTVTLCAAFPALQAAHNRARGMRSKGRLPVDAPWQVTGSSVRASGKPWREGEGDDKVCALPPRLLHEAMAQLGLPTQV